MPEPMTQGDSLRLQMLIRSLIESNPDLRRNFEAAVQYEEDHSMTEAYDGWEYGDVGAFASTLYRLMGKGAIAQVSNSRSHKVYRLVDLQATKSALESPMHDTPLASVKSAVSVDDLFDLVIGHEKVKTLVRYALKADTPKSVLLIGPPGTSKTLILQDIATLPKAYYYEGGTTTKAGLVDFLLQVRPKYLILDEFDQMPAVEMAPLLNLMETGIVSRLQHGHQDQVHMKTWVFAGANNLQKIPPNIKSRFMKVDVPGYTAAEYVDIATQVLVKRHGQGPKMAELIARTVAKHSTDIRAAVHVADMAKGDPQAVMEIVECLWPTKEQKIYPLRRD